MSSEKTERLINLTLGLLSSKRYLTKNEFTKDELLLMTMAANVWKESAFADISKKALMKISSIDGEIGLNSVALSMIDQQDLDQQQFQIILEAISTKQYLSFAYKGKKRLIAPLALKSANGFWYLVGQEKEGLVKIFKIVRIESKVEIDSTSITFERPVDFDLELFFNDRENRENRKAILRIRENRVNALRNRGEVQVGSDGWDLLTLEFDDLDQIAKEILWFADDVVVVSPQELLQDVMGRLKVAANG